jgi:RNA polymerase sigma-70 factor, ECF subfamily
VADAGDITNLLLDVRAGNVDAMARLMPIVYRELRRLAANYMRQERPDHTLQPTALVHEAYLRLVGQTERNWQNRVHFFAVAAQAMRTVLIDHARANLAGKRGGGQVHIELDHALNTAAPEPPGCSCSGRGAKEARGNRSARITSGRVAVVCRSQHRRSCSCHGDF